MNETVRWHALKRNTWGMAMILISRYAHIFTRRRCGTAAVKAPFEKYAEEIDWRLLAAIAYQDRTGMRRPLHRRVCAA